MSLGYYGNVWVRQNNLHGVGAKNRGHKHKFDHVSLLTEGTVRVTIEGGEAKEFTAPTFIIIRKEHNHWFEAVTDKVTWYCVFALRDFEGEVIENMYGPEHDPSATERVPDDYWERMENLEKLTTHEVDE